MQQTPAQCDLCRVSLAVLGLRPLLQKALGEVQQLYLVNPPSHSPRSSLHPVPSAPPGWVVPHSAQDSAARLAFRLAVGGNDADNARAARLRQARLPASRRKPAELPGIDYLVASESALHATLRLLFVPAELDRHRCWCGGLAEDDFPRLIRAAGKLAGTRLVLLHGTLPSEGLQQIMEELVTSHQMNYLMVDDAAALAGQQVWTKFSRAAMNCGVVLLKSGAAAQV